MVKLSSKRLIIKEGLRNEDYNALFEFFKDIDSIKYLSLAYKYMNFESLKEFKKFFEESIRKGFKFFGIYGKISKKFIGYMILLPRKKVIGIYIGSKYQKKGYGLESTKLFLDYLFNKLGYDGVLLDTCTKNLQAIKTYGRLGFKETKRVAKDRQILVKKGNQWNLTVSGTIYMELTKEQFNKP